MTGIATGVGDRDDLNIRGREHGLATDVLMHDLDVVVGVVSVRDGDDCGHGEAVEGRGRWMGLSLSLRLETLRLMSAGGRGSGVEKWNCVRYLG